MRKNKIHGLDRDVNRYVDKKNASVLNLKVVSLLLLLFTALLNSCKESKNVESWRHIEISPKDRSQTVTIITVGNSRYIIQGSHKDIPDSGYLLTDISQVDALGDAVSICWNKSGFLWKVASAYSKVVKNKLDASKYTYYDAKDEYGAPSAEPYQGEDCGALLIRENLKPQGNMIVKYILESEQ